MGAVAGFKYGVDLDGGVGNIIQGVKATGNGVGIYATNSILKQNNAENNSTDGIVANTNCLVIENVLIGNGIGLYASESLYGSKIMNYNTTPVVNIASISQK